MLNSELLLSEYRDGFLDAEGLEPYIGLGLLTRNQFNQITGKSGSNTDSSASQSDETPTSSSSFNPVK